MRIGIAGHVTIFETRLARFTVDKLEDYGDKLEGDAAEKLIAAIKEAALQARSNGGES